MSTFVMRHYEIVCPTIDNSGNDASHYAQNLRDALAFAGFDGWTEWDSLGFWHGKAERGRTFTIYADTCKGGSNTLTLLKNISRDSMPDQEFIQIVDHGYIELIEG